MSRHVMSCHVTSCHLESCLLCLVLKKTLFCTIQTWRHLNRKWAWQSLENDFKTTIRPFFGDWTTDSDCPREAVVGKWSSFFKSLSFLISSFLHERRDQWRTDKRGPAIGSSVAGSLVLPLLLHGDARRFKWVSERRHTKKQGDHLIRRRKEIAT
jgi:hypothetical protein